MVVNSRINPGQISRDVWESYELVIYWGAPFIIVIRVKPSLFFTQRLSSLFNGFQCLTCFPSWFEVWVQLYRGSVIVQLNPQQEEEGPGRWLCVVDIRDLKVSCIFNLPFIKIRTGDNMKSICLYIRTVVYIPWYLRCNIYRWFFGHTISSLFKYSLPLEPLTNFPRSRHQVLCFVCNDLRCDWISFTKIQDPSTFDVTFRLSFCWLLRSLRRLTGRGTG